MLAIPRRLDAGFTLVEILVALAVLGVFSLLAFHGLSQVVDGSAALKHSLLRVEDVGRAWAWLDETCGRTLLLRLPPSPPESQHAEEADPSGFVAEIWRPVADGGAPPQRVLLALTEGQLSAAIGPVGGRREGKPVAVLDGVAKFSLLPLDQQLQPIADWAARSGPDRTALPSAIEISLTLVDGRRFSRLFVPR